MLHVIEGAKYNCIYFDCSSARFFNPLGEAVSWSTHVSLEEETSPISLYFFFLEVRFL